MEYYGMTTPEQLQAQNLKAELPTGRVLFEEVSVSVQPGDKIALVGANGSGKSTLMKILAGKLQPQAGQVQGTESTVYVPQLDLSLFVSELSIFDYLSERSEEWWNILTILEVNWGITELDVNRKLNTLSGGELVKLNLSIALSYAPSILLLDEPTNHLDIPSKEQLRKFILGFAGGIVMVTHDPFFIDQTCTTVWELDDAEVSAYGGNYSDYRIQKQAEEEARGRKLLAKKKELKKTQQAREREQKRAARSQRIGREASHDNSMSAIEKGFFANKASGTAGANAGRTAQRETQIKAEIDDLTKRHQRGAIVNLDAGSTKNRGLFAVRKGELEVAGSKIIEGIELSVSGGDRIVITGKNGSGKTSLLRALMGTATDYQLTGDHVRVAPDLDALYLSQKYENVDPAKTLLDNVLDANPGLNYEAARKVLGNMLFMDDATVNQLAGTLSGGETARLAFAMAAASATDMLLLDEPTNNLDIETVDQILDALQGYPGGIVVISHDIDFLSRLGIESAYSIKSGRLGEMRHLPEDGESFYLELLNSEASES